MSANAVVGQLRANLALDSAEFEAGMARAKKSADALRLGLQKSKFKTGLDEVANDLAGRFQDTARRAGVLGTALSAMGAAGVVAGAGLGAVAIGLAGARPALALADQIGDAAAKLAMSTDALQEYRFAVHALGGEYEDADRALEGFAKTFGAAQSGLSAKALKPFEMLGLDPKAFKSTEDALAAVIDKIAALSSTAQQAAIADKLGLTPMLGAIRAGTGELDRLRQKAQDVGFVMDAGLIARAGEINDRFEDMTHIVDVRLKEAFLNLAPALGVLMEGAAAVATVLGDVAARFQDIEERSTRALRQQLNVLTARQIQLTTGVMIGSPVSRDLAARNDAEIARLQAELAARSQVSGAARLPGGGVLSDPNAAAAADAAAARAMRERQAAAEKLAASLKAARVADQDYLETLRRQEIQIGKSADELLVMEAGERMAAASSDEAAAAIWAQVQAVLAARKRFAELNPVLQQTGAIEFPALTNSAADLKAQLDALRAQAVDQLTLSFDGLFSALNNKDWGVAALGLISALKKINDARKAGASTASTIGAVAGVASGYVGGTGGKVLSGIAQGATLGSAIPGIGTVAGMVIGGLGGLLGGLFGGSSKKKAEREAAAKAAEEARQREADRQAQIALGRRAMEADLLELSGDRLGALALRRRMELDAMEPELRALQEEVWAKEDAATAAEEAAAAARDAADAQREQAEAARALAQEAYAAARANVETARQALRAAYEREAAAITDLRDRMQGMADTLRGWLGGGTAGGESAVSVFRRVADEVALGNAEAAAQFGQAADAFIGERTRTARTELDVVRAQAQARNAALRGIGVAERQVSIAQQQLEALNASVAGWMTLNDSTLSVRDAIVALAGAFGVQARLQGAAMDPQWGAPQNAGVNRALAQATGYTGAFGAGGFQSFITGAQPCLETSLCGTRLNTSPFAKAEFRARSLSTCNSWQTKACSVTCCAWAGHPVGQAQ